MAIQDRLLELVSGFDPEAITAFGMSIANVDLAGSALDTRLNNVYGRFGSFAAGAVPYNYPSDKPLFMNVFVGVAGVQENLATDRYIFGLFSDGALTSGSLTSKDNILGMASFSGAELTKGASVSVPIASLASAQRYLQAGVGCYSAASDETARFDMWLSIDPVSWKPFQENRR